MKNLSSTTRAILATRNFSIAHFYTFTLFDGTILRYTDGDQDLTYGGNTWLCGGQTGPFIGGEPGSGNKIRAHWKLGTEVDTITFDILPKDGTVEGEPFLSACRLGFFDKADIVIDRMYMPGNDYGNTSGGPVNIFTGKVSDVDIARSAASFTCNGLTVLLNQQLPRNVYQAGCLHTLYDSGCALSRTNFSSTAKASSASTVSSILSTGLASATGTFDLGSLKFTGGDNNGFSRGIKTYTHSTGSSASTISLMGPFPFTPAASDPFTIYRGCNKVYNDGTRGCLSFNNQDNFKGFPYLPEPVTAI